MSNRERLLEAIEAQEQLRGIVDDEVLDTAIATLRSQLDDSAEATQRRRHVSVLFADVAGFTALSEAIDPEVVAELMNDLWFAIDDVIDGHGGRIDKHIGDAVMGVWGVAGVREDDAERAVRAGLDVIEVFSEFRSRHDLAIDVRAGVNTGLVLFGAIGRGGELSVTGDAVNVASRLEHAAPPGSLLISRDTYRQVRGVFDVRPRQPIDVKGKSESLHTYLVERAKPRSFKVPTRGVQGAVTEIVGRDAELDVLCDAYRRAIDGSQATIVTVLGEAGVGKSRLLDEFVSWVDLQHHTVHYLRGRSLPGWEAVPRGLFREMLGDRYDIHDDDDSENVLAKLVGGLDGLSPPEAELLGRWLGFGVGEPTDHSALAGTELDNTARAHLTAQFRSVLERQPVVIVFEDLHWADHESLDAVLHLVARFATSPLLVVGVARPNMLDRRPDWPEAAHEPTHLTLNPLSEGSTRQLARQLLGRLETVPDELVETIASRSDGNPLHVEEIVKMLIDESVIVAPADGVWTYEPDRLNAAKVPASLLGVLQARLDALRASDLRVIQRAAVIGRTFWDDAVVALTGDNPTDSEGPDAALERTQRLEIIRKVDGSALSGCVEYRFKHALLRDAAYETVLLRDRPELHARAADWLERRTGRRSAEHLGPIAEHRDLAGQHDLAASAFRNAADEAARTGALQPAVRRYQRALRSLAEIDADHTAASIEMRIGLGRALDLLGDADEAARILATADTDAQADGDANLRLRVALRRSSVCTTIGDWPGASRWLDRAGELIDGADELLVVELEVAQAQLLANTEDPARAVGAARRALESSRRTGDQLLLERALNNLAGCLARRGDADGSMSYIDQALAVARSSGALHREAQMLSNKGALLHIAAGGDRDRLNDAIVHYGRASRIYEDIGSSAGLGTRLNLVQAQLEAGHIRNAPDDVWTCLHEAWRRNLSHEWGIAVLVLAQARIAQGDRDEGLLMLGALRADSRTERLDEEIDRLLVVHAVDPDQATVGMSAGAGVHLDDLVDQLLAEATDIAPYEMGPARRSD